MASDRPEPAAEAVRPTRARYVVVMLATVLAMITCRAAVSSARCRRRVGRTFVGGAAYAVAGLAMILAATTDRGMLAGGLIAVAVAASMFSLAPSWATCLDVAGEHAGVLSAMMNTSGQIGSLLSPIVVISLARGAGGWDAPLCLTGALFLIGAVAWSLIDPRKRLFD